MSHLRRPRAARTVSATLIDALDTGQPLTYSPEAWEVLCRLYYFSDPLSTPEQRDAARGWLDAWRERHQRESD